MLSVLDGLWKDHLLSMDHLKEGIGLRGYAQQDPLVACGRESFEMFEAMMLQFQQDTARHLFRMQIIGPDGNPIETVEQMPPRGPADGQVLPPSGGRAPQGQAASQPRLPMDLDGDGQPQERQAVPIHTRAPSTTIDELEKEFQRKKRSANWSRRGRRVLGKVRTAPDRV